MNYKHLYEMYYSYGEKKNVDLLQFYFIWFYTCDAVFNSYDIFFRWYFFYIIL